jgi:predicted transglutaminase-like cysteine proteinase
MKIIIIILFFILTSYSADFANSSLISKVEKKYNRFAKNRFLALNKLLTKLEKSNTATKLEKVNDFFNAVKYGDDKDVYGTSDYWASPYEFLAKDKGDCEDYVIAKYFALKHLGIPTSKMFLSYVRIDGAKDAHMVLTYFETPNSEPLILDSIRKVIFPASKRGDLKPIYNFNPNILEKGGKTAAHRKWDVVLKNFRENKI